MRINDVKTTLPAEVCGPLVRKALTELEANPDLRLLKALARVRSEAIYAEAMRALEAAQIICRAQEVQVRFSRVVKAVTKAAFMNLVAPDGAFEASAPRLSDGLSSA